MSFSLSTEIAHDPAGVFAYVADFENSPRWQSAVSESERLDEGEIGVGSRFREKADAFGMSGWVTIEITDFEPERLIGYRSTRFGIIAPIASFEFAPAGDGTRMTVHGNPNPATPFQPLSSLIGFGAKQMWKGNLATLRELLERPDGERSSPAGPP